MKLQGRTGYLLASAVAALLASAGSAVVASAVEFEGDDDAEGVKRVACGLIGCPGGNRVCGSASGTVKAGIPPFVGEVSVEYICYESNSF